MVVCLFWHKKRVINWIHLNPTYLCFPWPKRLLWNGCNCAVDTNKSMGHLWNDHCEIHFSTCLFNDTPINKTQHPVVKSLDIETIVWISDFRDIESFGYWKMPTLTKFTTFRSPDIEESEYRVIWLSKHGF